MWAFELRGGDYDGWAGTTEQTLEPVVVVWHCREHRACDGHASFDVNDPRIILSRAQAYQLVETDEATRTGFYVVGDIAPGGVASEHVAVPVGVAMAVHDDGTVTVSLGRPQPAPAGWTAAAYDDGDPARALGLVMCLILVFLLVAGVVLTIVGVL